MMNRETIEKMHDLEKLGKALLHANHVRLELVKAQNDAKKIATDFLKSRGLDLHYKRVFLWGEYIIILDRGNASIERLDRTE